MLGPQLANLNKNVSRTFKEIVKGNYIVRCKFDTSPPSDPNAIVEVKTKPASITAWRPIWEYRMQKTSVMAKSFSEWWQRSHEDEVVDKYSGRIWIRIRAW
jgi:hypothetical protein